MRLIDAEQVFCAECEDRDSCDHVTCDVKNYPTINPADLVPKGRWEFVEQRFYHGGFINLFRCSECKAATDKTNNFCPNCGADMRERADGIRPYGETGGAEDG